MAYNKERVTVKDTRFIFRTNFRGERTQYNNRGDREFNIELPDDLAKDLEGRGWNVKWREPREEGDAPIAHIAVRVNFESAYPPRVWLINADTGSRTMMDEDTIGQIDHLLPDEITSVNVIMNPSHWENNNGSGIKAYCQSMQVYFIPDPFEAEYEAKYGSNAPSAGVDDVPFD